VLAERRNENASREHSPVAAICGEGPWARAAKSLVVLPDDVFDSLGVCEVGVEFPDRGCNAPRDVEDDVRVSFRGVAGADCCSFAIAADLICCLGRDLRLSVRVLRVMFTISVAKV
jgi:hypothetical protein